MKLIKKMCLFTILVSGLLVFSIPFIIMTGNSFEEFTFTLPNPPRLIPKDFTISNYLDIVSNYNILNFFGNSVIIAVCTTVIVIFISSMSAYGFAKISFPGRKALFRLYIFTLMIPGVLNIIPQFITINNLGLIGTRTGLILLYTGTGICGNTFFLRGFFEGIPNELLESVMMDGGSHLAIYSKIVMPLSRPALATLSILVLLGTWDDFLTAKVILGAKESILTLPIMIHRLNGQHATKFGLVFAASLISLTPVFVIYIIMQKYFVVGGLSQGAIKE